MQLQTYLNGSMVWKKSNYTPFLNSTTDSQQKFRIVKRNCDKKWIGIQALKGDSYCPVGEKPCIVITIKIWTDLK
jgi:hypothetical protein